MARSLDIPAFRDARSASPWLIRAGNRLGRLVSSGKPIEANSIWRSARKGGLESCEPTVAAREALSVLLESLAANVALTPIGRVSAADDTIRMARTHLRIHRALAETPEITRTELPPPVFIIGWPRTGTTFLHQLLARNPAHRTVPYWESFDPVPPEPGKPDRRVAKLDKMLGQLRRVAPRYDAIHPMEADSVEECVTFFMNEFRTLQFDFQYRVPGYARWLLAEDARIGYSAYREQLCLIQFHRPLEAPDGSTMLLKDPTHLLHLETIVEMFPDARFIFTHRDPAEALSSMCSLVAYTRALFTDDVDPRSVGEEMLGGYWPEGLEASRKIRANLPAGRAVDVRHPELREDPIGTAERIHRELGLPLDDAARSAMGAFLDGRESKDSGRHVHSLEGFGLSRERVRDRLSGYCNEVDI